MRRWLAIFLLTLLPLQFSSAVVAAYCGHESGLQVQHFGHHEHAHDGHGGAHAGPTPADADAPAGWHADCSHCHGSSASLPVATRGVALELADLRPVPPAQGKWRTLAMTPPERPQWATLA